MNPPPVYKPDNSLRPSPAQAKMVQPKMQPVTGGAPQLRAVNPMGAQHLSRPGMPQPIAHVAPRINKTAPVFPPAIKSPVPVSAIRPPAFTANVSLVQQRPAVQRSLVQRSFVQAKPIVQQKPGAQVLPKPMVLLSRGLVQGLIRVPGTIQRNSLPSSHFGAARIAPANLNRMQHGVAPHAMVIQRMQAEESWGSWALGKVGSFGSWITGHPIPKTFSALINLADGIVTVVAISLQTAGVAIGASVTKLIQSVNSAAKLAAAYSQEDEGLEKDKLRAQLVVECVNILTSIITLILATQGALAASIWTNAILTLLSKTSGELYEVYRSWKDHNSQQSLMSASTYGSNV